MTEGDARAWITAHYPVRQPIVAAFLEMVEAENMRQNLVSPATIPTIWARHAVDSAQLLGFAPATGRWLDIGSGGGFPGVIVAILRDEEIILAEPRRKRAEFLSHCIAALDLANAEVLMGQAQTVDDKAAIISARAVAAIDRLAEIGRGAATSNTQWILPRGSLSIADMATAKRHFGSMFHVERSITDPASSILLAKGIPA